MKLPMYQLDVFTSRTFGGNPAAVVVMERWLDDALLQAIAAENNLAETAFVVPHGECSPLRRFTPAMEMDLCGHATLAAADVLFREYFPAREDLRFDTRSGEVGVARRAGRSCLDFPARPGEPVRLERGVIAALGIAPIETIRARDLMVVLGSESEVADFVPDYRAIAALDAFALIVTAPGEDVDFVSRFFAPRAGIPEDPVTGSAHCTLIPYWAARLRKTRLSARQLSARKGELWCEHNGERVSIGGDVVQYLRGEIDVPTHA